MIIEERTPFKMKIVVINPPFRYNDKEWITIPPQGYGGIQWIIKNLVDGLNELGVDVLLAGAPGSISYSPHLQILDIAESDEINAFLRENGNKYLISDHSCRGIEFGNDLNFDCCSHIIHSHYLTSKPQYTKNIVAASYSHAEVIGCPNATIIRHPINPANYTFSDKKDNYLLFMGRVSYWKGTHLAAEFARKVGMKLKIVGPAWEKDYFEAIKSEFKNTIEYYGEAGGDEKKEILSKAVATLVFSGGVHLPTGLKWVEPGSQIVSESGISGTPVISSNNGCLKEIVPHIGTVIDDFNQLTPNLAEKILTNLPTSQQVFDASNREWNYIKIAKEYIQLFERVMRNQEW